MRQTSFRLGRSLCVLEAAEAAEGTRCQSVVKCAGGTSRSRAKPREEEKQLGVIEAIVLSPLITLQILVSVFKNG